MMRSVLNSAGLLVLVGMLGLGSSGCGSEVGPAGSDGLKDTGWSVVAEVTPDYLDKEGTYDVDILQGICDEDPEDFTRHGAIARFDLQPLTVVRQNLSIDRYKVEFTNLVPGTPPIASYERFQNMTLGAAVGIYESGVDFVDLDRKDKLLEDFLSGVYPNATINEFGGTSFPAYAAEYTFYGSDVYGNRFSLKANVSFTVGNYDYCQ